MEITNRRYIGSKKKLLDWIFKNINKYTSGNTFCDMFAGTGCISDRAIEKFDKIIINDILFSNEVIYKAFFSNEKYDLKKLNNIKDEYNKHVLKEIDDNYFNINFGEKYFGMNDAKKIGFLREDIERKKEKKVITNKEYNILLASLIYSADKIANTVGHYEAYRKVEVNDNRFEFNLIKPKNVKNKEVKIYRKDANELAKNIFADIVFIDPPYNSRQYSRFYHVLENLVKWEKPKLYGVALKPKEENMSEYCRKNAPIVFKNLIDNLKCKYIIVTYNNTYNSKSSSSQNKIAFEKLKKILNEKGKTKIFSAEHVFFNSGKTEFVNHREFLFITKVSSDE